LPEAGSAAVFGDSASARAMSVTLICTFPASAPSAAMDPVPSMTRMSAADPRTITCPLRIAM